MSFDGSKDADVIVVREGLPLVKAGNTSATLITTRLDISLVSGDDKGRLR